MKKFSIVCGVAGIATCLWSKNWIGAVWALSFLTVVLVPVKS